MTVAEGDVVDVERPLLVLARTVGKINRARDCMCYPESTGRRTTLARTEHNTQTQTLDDCKHVSM